MQIRITYWQLFDWFFIITFLLVCIMFLVSGCGGKHYDCDKIRHQEHDFKSASEATEAVNYCLYDSMTDLCNAAKYGSRACDWRR